MRLQTKILLGLLAGLVLGGLARLPALAGLRTIIAWSEPAGTVFIRLITMVVIPLVAGSLFTSVASLGSIRRLGRIGLRTLGWFAVTTAIAAVIGLAVALLAGAGAGLDPSVRDTIADPSLRQDQRVSERGRRAGPQADADRNRPAESIAAAAQGDLPLIFAIVLFVAAATALDENAAAHCVVLRRGQRRLNGRHPVAMVLAPWAWVSHRGDRRPVGLDLLRSLAAYALIVVIALVVHVILVLLPVVRLGRAWESVNSCATSAMRCSSRSRPHRRVSRFSEHERRASDSVSGRDRQLRAAHRNDAQQERGRGLQGCHGGLPRQSLWSAAGPLNSRPSSSPRSLHRRREPACRAAHS
jgi:DAACS family dicarboxylate/amino acid:cation (Na+ or H+) symporter